MESLVKSDQARPLGNIVALFFEIVADHSRGLWQEKHRRFKRPKVSSSGYTVRTLLDADADVSWRISNDKSPKDLGIVRTPKLNASAVNGE